MVEMALTIFPHHTAAGDTPGPSGPFVHAWSRKLPLRRFLQLSGFKIRVPGRARLDVSYGSPFYRAPESED